jgi:hypothetical protein
MTLSSRLGRGQIVFVFHRLRKTNDATPGDVLFLA